MNVATKLAAFSLCTERQDPQPLVWGLAEWLKQNSTCQTSMRPWVQDPTPSITGLMNWSDHDCLPYRNWPLGSSEKFWEVTFPITEINKPIVRMGSLGAVIYFHVIPKLQKYFPWSFISRWNYTLHLRMAFRPRKLKGKQQKEIEREGKREILHFETGDMCAHTHTHTHPHTHTRNTSGLSVYVVLPF
jgi:hypothetical protein